jgi:hypothetical protein
MSDRETRIRAKLEVGALPRDLPPSALPRDAILPKIRMGVSAGAICSGCDGAIGVGETMCDYSYPDGIVLRFHGECEGLWEKHRCPAPS